MDDGAGAGLGGGGTRTQAGAFVSAREVAARAGVSRSAVSRTFTPGASVAEETRRRVLTAAAELGYQVNHLARSLSARQTGIVCLVVSDMASPQMSRLLNRLTRRFQDAGRVAMVLGSDGAADDGRALLQKAVQYRAEATVVLSGTPSPAIVRTCLDNGQRLVLISRADRVEGPDNLRLDNASAARAAVVAFLRGGCRGLAVVTTENRTPSLMARETAFIDAAAAVGLAVSVVAVGRTTAYENGADAARRLLAAPERPDAVFCVNDVTALGVMDVARHEFGLRVPQDLSVIGFDNIPQADWLSYQLTSFDQPIDAMADAVVRLVEAQRQPSDEPAMLEFSPTLVWRKSVRC